METTKKRISIYIVVVLVIVLLTGGIIAMALNRTTPVSVDELLSLGEKYLLELDYEQALVQFLKVIEIEPMNPRGYTGAAEAYIGMDDIESAIAILEQGLEASDDTVEIAALLAELTEPEPEPELEPEPEPEPMLQELVVEELPQTEYIIGAPLDLTGLVVKAIYDNGTEREIEDYATDPAEGDILEASNTSVTITHTEQGATKTVFFAVAVTEPELETELDPKKVEAVAESELATESEPDSTNQNQVGATNLTGKSAFSLQDLADWGYPYGITVWDVEDEVATFDGRIEYCLDQMENNGTTSIEINARAKMDNQERIVEITLDGVSYGWPSTGPRGVYMGGGSTGMGYEEALRLFQANNDAAFTFAADPPYSLKDEVIILYDNGNGNSASIYAGGDFHYIKYSTPGADLVLCFPKSYHTLRYVDIVYHY